MKKIRYREKPLSELEKKALQRFFELPWAENVFLGQQGIKHMLDTKRAKNTEQEALLKAALIHVNKALDALHEYSKLEVT